MLTRMENRSDGLYSNARKRFTPKGILDKDIIEATFEFAYAMSFGNDGKHRNHRSGGTHSRKNGEIFANAFQGKISEFAVYESLKDDFELLPPDTETYGLGQWDDVDLKIGSKAISVKSTKSYGDLLLLETKDWNTNGQYIPNLNKGCSEYDFFILVRINPFCEEILKGLKYLYSNETNASALRQKILTSRWQYDIPGFVDKGQVIYAIRNEFIIRRGQLLNGKTRMDADNYYIQSGDMHNITSLKYHF